MTSMIVLAVCINQSVHRQPDVALDMPGTEARQALAAHLLHYCCSMHAHYVRQHQSVNGVEKGSAAHPIYMCCSRAPGALAWTHCICHQFRARI